MSCGVMYQSHYSYFPYQRNLLESQNNKQGLSDHDVHLGRSLEEGGGSPNQYSFSTSRHTSPSSFSSQGGLSAHSSTGFPTLLRDPSLSTESSFLPGRDTVRTGSETGFQPQPGPTARPEGGLDKVKGEKDKELEKGHRNAQYLSANCVIFTYYSGDITAAVDDHFSKALSQSSDRENVPMSARNFPASFWDASWVPAPAIPPASTELYADYGDPWQSYMASMTGYSAHQMYTARSYSSLLLQSRREWVEQNYPASPYPAMSGLDGTVQPGTKDLYWF